MGIRDNTLFWEYDGLERVFTVFINEPRELSGGLGAPLQQSEVVETLGPQV